MNELAQKQCKEVSGETAALNSKEAESLLLQLEPRWQLDADARNISYRFGFDNFYQTMAFVNVIAQIAHQQDHHPEMTIGYKNCLVTYTTHDAGGLSLKDMICAAKINRALQL
ncbi:MAG TPA: 4a-hydroxytetrahydrobiopterin dehydratase [Gammaproteobacteria bacterium]|nr:4a-hydroxytetrahydrobiopterin dehydratase [Gammaproteobacteria bacterium]